jgi:hypothetical protein
MEGWQFAAELAQLRIISQVDLPALSWTYASMNHAVNGTVDQQGTAFAAPGGGVATSQAPWSQLRDDLQNILGKTAGNLQDAAVTIEQIVDAYAESDHAARDSLNAAWANGQTPGLVEAEQQFSRTNPPAIVTKD